MGSYARRRRSTLWDQWRPHAVVAFALAVHAAFLTFVEPPEDPVLRPISRGAAGEDLATIEGPGGTYAVSASCMSSAFAGGLARVVVCQLSSPDERPTCMRDAISWYRAEKVACSTPETVQFAELDATPLVDEDAIDLDMLELDLEDMIEEVKDEAIEDNLRGQVVEVAPPAVEQRPDDYEYLAEYDSAVEKQTVKRGKPGAQAPPPPPTPPQPQMRETPQPSEPGKPGGGALSMRAPGTPGAPEVDQKSGSPQGLDRVSLNGVGAMRGIESIDPMGPVGGGGQNGAGAGETARPSRPLNLRPTSEMIDRATGGSNDHLPGVEEGERTALNTRKWKYATFFNRVKRQVAQNWHPEKAYRLRDPNGNIYGTKDRMTILTVSLEPDGSLREVVISNPSGVDFLDDEAIKAFELAEPFPNPPVGLVDGDNLITFRFGFSFEINSRTPWRVFRYR